MTIATTPRSFVHPEVVWARGKFTAWELFTIVFLALVYLSMTAEGWRMLIPTTARKLSKTGLPLLNRLALYEETRNLDIAHGLALVLMVLTMIFLFLAIRSLGEPDSIAVLIPRAIAGVLVFGDGFLFYRAVEQMSWGGGAISLTALVATLVWVGILCGVSYFSVVLSENVLLAKKGY